MTAAADVANRVAQALGPKRVISAPEELAAYSVDGVAPGAIVRPANAQEVVEVVRLAVAEKLATLPLGSRSKCESGMACARYDIALDMTAMNTIAHYDAGDLTLSVDAGMPLRELEICLQAKGQFLPLAVPCFESTTAGGAIASGMDSALRLQYGTARDFLIGAEFVDGTGQLCKSGGRVVKNVTGYDLHKLLIGSLGTLGVITRLNFRTFPLPVAFGGHVAAFATLPEALQFRKAVEDAGLPLANLEVLSPSVVEMVRAILQRDAHAVPAELEHGEWIVYSSCAGSEPVVQRVVRELENTTAGNRAQRLRILETAEDEVLGGMLREAYEWLRWASAASVIWRFALPQIHHEPLSALLRLAASTSLRAGMLVRAAGIVYLAVFADSEDQENLAGITKMLPEVRAIARTEKGCCTLLHAPPAIKTAAAAGNDTAASAGLHQRVKLAFDPSNVFAPGRMVGGI